MKKLALIVVLLTTCVSFAKTWHVEQATGDDAAAAADTSGKTPFKSIQKALSNSNLRNGDTVLVGDGVYTTADGISSSTSNGRACLNITKAITLKSVNGPAKTHIVGKQSIETPEGLGDDAVRCIMVNVGADGTKIIEGFTIRDGASPDTNQTKGRGGAVYGYNSSVSPIFIVNCVITNCVSYNYVMNSPNLRGCRVEDCYVRTGAVVEKGTAAFTLFAGMRNENDVSVTRGIKAVNCTFVTNRGSYDFLESESYVNHVYNSICSASGDVKLDKSATGPMDAPDSLIGTSNAYPLMAPYFGDYRVRAGSAAEGTGDAAWLDKVSLPDGWAYGENITDPYGNPIDVDHLHLGAIQETATPAGGGLRLASGVTLEDGPAAPHVSYVFPTNYPIQYKMGASLAAGKQLFGFSLSPVTTAPYRFPKWGENHIYTMPSPDPTKVTTNKIVLVDETIWVEPGEPGTGDGTYENPYGTLNDAIDNASQSSTYYLICAKGGVYNNGADSAGASYGKAVVALNMRAKNVRLVAVDGPANTTIEGACDPETGGCGANAVRCVLLYLTTGTGVPEGFAAVQGFTLTGGYSLKANDGRYGAAIYGSGSDYCFVTDCRICGNNGTFGACAGALFERCEIFDNRTSTGIVTGKKNTVLSSCLIHNNRGVKATDGALGMNVTAVNCTVAENPASSHALGTDYAQNAWNCVIAGGNSTGEKAVLDGCVLWDFDTYKSALKGGYQKLDPYWVNPHPDDLMTTDLRSFLISDVFTAGTLPTTENSGADLYQYVGADFSGNRMTFGETSMPAGAYTAGAPYVLIVADKGGIGTDGKVGFNVLEGEATLDVYGSGVADRPCVGVFVGDELKLFDNLEGGDGIPPETVRITAAEAVAGLTVTAAYTNEWYVKPDGSDASSGFTQKHAKKTFAAVMGCAQAGDTVRCVEADYGDEAGSMTEGGNVARVVVKNGVTLAGAGIGKTIIRGKAHPGGRNGCGSDALRCVILAGSTAKVKDLTMIDGHSDLVGTSSKDYANHDENFGGGVFASSTGATVENCLITNCVAVRGGGSYSAKLVNCRVVGNSARFADNGAAALYYGSAYGTVFLNNDGSDYTVMYPTVLENCTIAGNNTTSKTGRDFFIKSTSTCTLKNTLIAGSSTLNGTGKACTISHCAFASDASPTIPAEETDGTCVYAPLADFAFDAEGRPIAGANPAIDKGDLTQFRESICGAFDASGFQRVMNGTMDIGALEADWRGRYRKDLKVRLGEVLAATPGIVENAQGKVVLSDGDALDLSWSHRCAGTSQLNVTIIGEGALTIRKGDETLATVTETTSIDYPVSPDVTDELTFAFAGAGSASFDVTDAHFGFMMMVR